MALPIIRSLTDCASYARTVEPFIDELYDTPNHVAAAVKAAFSSGVDGGFAPSLAPLTQLYLDTNPLVSGFCISVALGAVFLVVSEINRNYSQVDRCWSLLPTAYIAHFNLWARLSGVPSQRLDAALLYSTVWSVSVLGNPTMRSLAALADTAPVCRSD